MERANVFCRTVRGFRKFHNKAKVSLYGLKLFYAYALLVGLLTIGCSPYRTLRSGESLLVKNTVSGTDAANPIGLDGLIRQKQNTTILGSPLLVRAWSFGYNFFDSSAIDRKISRENYRYNRQLAKGFKTVNDSIKQLTRHEKRLFNLEKKKIEGNFFMKSFGEPPVVFDSLAMHETARQMKAYLFNTGYFDGLVLVEKKYLKSGKQVSVNYRVTEGRPYAIRRLNYFSGDSKMDSLLRIDTSARFIKSGDNYDRNRQDKERERIEYLFRNNGYHDFSRKYVVIENDTAPKKQGFIDTEVKVLTPPELGKHQRYKIGFVNHIMYDTAAVELPKEYFNTWRKVDYYSFNRQYSFRTLDAATRIYPGEWYSFDKVQKARNRLASLDIFKFVTVTLDSLGPKGYGLNFATTRLARYQVSQELGMIVSQGAPGPFVNLGFKMRNPFGGFEIFEINGRYSDEGQITAYSNGEVFRTTEFAINGSLSFPRIIPTGPKGYLLNDYQPRTRLILGYNDVNRPDYSRVISRFTMQYSLQPAPHILLGINPIDVSINFTRTLAPGFRSLLDSLVNQGNNLRTSFNNALVTEFTTFIQYNAPSVGLHRPSYFFRLNLEGGGLFGNFMSNQFYESKDSVGKLKVFRFARITGDFRYTKPLTRLTKFAFRFNFGAAIPLGRSADLNVLPYEKYLFSGGSNSIRAWAPRRLGPGSQVPTDRRADGTFGYRFEQPGELLLEWNFEYRQKITSLIETAIFCDAGNVWRWSSTQGRFGSDFAFNRFFKEIAVALGVGIRLDFDFLVLRGDVGIKTWDPAYPIDQRFRLNQLSWRRPLGLQGQSQFNIGIGYPF